MKKNICIILIALLALCSLSAFDFGGGFYGVVCYTDYTDGGLGLFIDATYVTVKGGGTFVDDWELYALAKYPFVLGDFSVFPLAGVNWCENLYLVFGAGVDYYLPVFDKLYFRLDAGYGFNLTRSKNTGYSSSTAYYGSPFGKFFTTLGMGFRF